MIDKIEMTVTVNPLVSPRLHQRLRACSSPRQRAIVFRALAEARLWDETMGNAQPVERGASDRRELTYMPVTGRQERPVQRDAAPTRPAVARSAEIASRSPDPPASTGSETAESMDTFQPVRSADSDDLGSALGDALGNDVARFE
jgi:hypothetical protein